MNTVNYELRGNVAEIMLNRAPVNALVEATLTELLQALRAAAADPEVRVVILGSQISGKFCAGLDLKALHGATPVQVHDLVTKLYVELFDAQFNLGKPSICVVTGATRGGGMTVAVSCDMVVATESSTFGYPEIDNGILPAIHYAHLPRIIGRQRAFDLLFTGRNIDANEALSLGLINRVAPEGEALETAREIARTLATKPAGAMRLGKRAFMQSLDNGYRREIASAVEYICTTIASPEAQEGLNAFAQKRSPNWAGR